MENASFQDILKKHGVKMSSETNNQSTKYPERAAEVYVTQKMLYGVRDELKNFTKSNIRRVESQLEGLKSEMHHLGVIIEEQNAKNNAVLDNLSHLWNRQDRVESTLEEIKNLLQLIPQNLIKK
ncbi:MAG: hypothetical protein V4596_13540 [Bdellovibrionota bacterium]